MKLIALAVLNSLLLVGSCATERYTTKIENLKNEIVVKDSLEVVKYANTITVQELKAHLYSYASAEFEGRATGTKGQKRATAYLQNYYQRQEIASPISELSYFQNIPESYFSNDIKASENVLAYIKGSEKPDEIIVISGHLDHEGIKNGDIYYGADDNGSGTSAILEIAQAFKKATDDGFRPKRSILFLHFTAEELGLQGSRYYTENPIFPLENTVANLNMDMIGRVDKTHQDNPNYVYLIGSDRLSTELHYISEKANNAFTNLTLDYQFNDKNDRNRFYYRSDHYNFAKHNIPVIFYFNGVHEDYHKPSDIPKKINFEILKTRTQLIFATAWQIANRDERLVVDKEE